MAAEEFVAESQKPFYKTTYKKSPNKGKRIFNSIHLNLFTLSRCVAMGGRGERGRGGLSSARLQQVQFALNRKHAFFDAMP